MNIRDGLTLTQLVRASGLARGTVYRMLQSLQALGYVERNDALGTHHLTVKVQSLSHGFDDETWTLDVARPILIELGNDISWPASLATCLGTTVTIRETTDDVSPLVFTQFKSGYRIPILGSSSGWVFLAFSSPSDRQSILDLIERSEDRTWSSLAARRSSVQRILDQVKKDGFHVLPYPAIKVTAVSVPVFKETGGVLAALTVRYFASALSQDEAVRQLLPKMNAASQRITQDHGTWLNLQRKQA